MIDLEIINIPEKTLQGRNTSISGVGNLKMLNFPKYYFDAFSYGQFINFARQGLDSKFDSPFTAEEVVIDEPVKVQFVESDFDNDNLNFRIFRKVEPRDVNNTAYQTFQSSNLSLHATSSIPFVDTDFNVSTNRTYTQLLTQKKLNFTRRLIHLTILKN